VKKGLAFTKIEATLAGISRPTLLCMNRFSAGFLRLVAIAGLSFPVLVAAQGRFDSTGIPMQFLETSPWTVSAGLRFSTTGASVAFGELGNVTSNLTVAPLGSGAVQRLYHDGGVGMDGARNNETDAAGNVFSTPGGRYAGRTVDSAGNESFIGDYLSYTADRTRNWGYQTAGQIGGDGRLALNVFSAQSSGATAAAEAGASGGFEISVNRRLRRFGKRAEFGITGMFGMNDIDAATSGSIRANLVALTDYYRLYAPAPEAPYTGPVFQDLKDAAGNVILVNGQEITVPLGDFPDERRTNTTINGANILGNWKINGAYYVFRVGPSVRIFITNRLALSFDAGLATAFVGSQFQVEESIQLDTLDNPISTTETGEKTDFLMGFYGAGAVEYWMTDRTNAHAGAAYESLDRYQQSISGRTADIDIGSTITVRLGLTTRF
jgi:hypothetical protein